MKSTLHKLSPILWTKELLRDRPSLLLAFFPPLYHQVVRAVNRVHRRNASEPPGPNIRRLCRKLYILSSSRSARRRGVSHAVGVPCL